MSAGHQGRGPGESASDFRNRVLDDIGDFLQVPQGNRPVVPGTLLPLIGATFVRQPSGVFIPESAARLPRPIDLIGTYITHEEIFGFRLGLEYVTEALRTVSRNAFIRACAELLGYYESIRLTRKQVDQALVAQWFKEPMATRLREELRGNRTLVSPQTLLLLIEFALLVSPEAAPEGNEPVHLARLALGLQDDLGHTREETGEISDNVFRGEVASRLFREVVSSHDFASWTSEGSTIGHHQLRWNVLPDAHAGNPRSVDLVALFAEATGVAKDDFTAIATLLWVDAEIRNRYPSPHTLLESLTIPADQVEAGLALFAATPDQLKSEVERLFQRFPTQWSFDPVRRFPVLRVNGDMLVLSKHLLMERMLGWLPIFDVDFGLRAHGRREDADRAVGWFRLMCEADARAGLADLAPPVGKDRRLYGEAEIQTAFGTGAPNADAALDYPRAWIVVEISTAQLKRETVVGGEPQALEDDLARIVDVKVEQLDATIGELIANESRLTGHPAVARTRYLPVLIATEGFPVNPMTMTAIKERISAAGRFADPRIGPLRIIDQEGLDMAEAIVEKGEATLLSLLEDHAASTLADNGLKDWLVLGRGRGVGPGGPQRMEPHQRAAWRPVEERVRQLSDPSPDGAGGGDLS